MEGEVYNLMVDLSILLASLLYCRYVGMFIAQGTTRFLALFPVICLYVFLPSNLKTMYFAGPTSFFVSWLGSFKLILYAFDQGPLSSYPPLPLSHFIVTACLPIKIVTNKEKISTHHQITKKYFINSPLFLFFILAISAYGYKDFLHPLVTMCIIAYYFSFMLIVTFVTIAFVVQTTLKVKLELQFRNPHYATSVQNFWGKRWNLMVSHIMRLAVYDPARAIFRHVVPEKWVSVPAVFATFLVSGLMHEMIFYYIGQIKPTWEVTCFLIVNGLWVGTEIVVKKTMGHRFELPTIVANPLTLAFVSLTNLWLLCPPLLRLDPSGRVCRETMAFLSFAKHGHLLSPEEHTCPFM